MKDTYAYCNIITALLYSYRHEKYSFGFAGRGGGNALYINTENNTMTHGPGNSITNINTYVFV